MDPIEISAGINAVGSLFKGITGFFTGNNQAKAYKAAALQAGQEAGVQSQVALQEGNAEAAQGAVQAAANGGGFTGSALGAIQNLSNQAMFNARAAAYRGQTEIQRDLYDAKVAKSQALMSLIGSVSPAASDIASGQAQSEMEDRQMQALTSLRGDGGVGSGGDNDLNGLY